VSKSRLFQNAPRDGDKLEQLLRSKERQNDGTVHVKEIERLVTEIEMIEVYNNPNDNYPTLYSLPFPLDQGFQYLLPSYHSHEDVGLAFCYCALLFLYKDH
jgi:hypothetical protein